MVGVTLTRLESDGNGWRDGTSTAGEDGQEGPKRKEEGHPEVLVNTSTL